MCCHACYGRYVVLHCLASVLSGPCCDHCQLLRRNVWCAGSATDVRWPISACWRPQYLAWVHCWSTHCWVRRAAGQLRISSASSRYHSWCWWYPGRCLLAWWSAVSVGRRSWDRPVWPPCVVLDCTVLSPRPGVLLVWMPFWVPCRRLRGAMNSSSSSYTVKRSSSCTTTRWLLCSTSRFQFAVSPIEFAPLHCGSMTNVILRSKHCGCQTERELLVALVFSRTPALPPLLPTAPSATSMSPSRVRRSPCSGPSASMLSNRSHVSSGGRLMFDKLLGRGKNHL